MSFIYTYRVVLAIVSGCLTAAYWLCGRRRQQDLDLEGELVRGQGVEEERDEALFNFPPGNNNEPPPPYVRIIKTIIITFIYTRDSAESCIYD